MRDPSGISRGSGFVAFSTSEEASRAVSQDPYISILVINIQLETDIVTVHSQLDAMNGKMIVGKPLYVALAQRKEERRARLQV